jgi:hypothetical protein
MTGRASGQLAAMYPRQGSFFVTAAEATVFIQDVLKHEIRSVHKRQKVTVDHLLRAISSLPCLTDLTIEVHGTVLAPVTSLRSLCRLTVHASNDLCNVWCWATQPDQRVQDGSCGWRDARGCLCMPRNHCTDHQRVSRLHARGPRHHPWHMQESPAALHWLL